MARTGRPAATLDDWLDWKQRLECQNLRRRYVERDHPHSAGESRSVCWSRFPNCICPAEREARR
jgi:hypothetical protein